MCAADLSNTSKLCTVVGSQSLDCVYEAHLLMKGVTEKKKKKIIDEVQPFGLDLFVLCAEAAYKVLYL